MSYRKAFNGWYKKSDERLGDILTDKQINRKYWFRRIINRFRRNKTL